MSKCSGCGITLQNTQKDDLGYTPNLDNKYCERCFKTIHYNVVKKIPPVDNNKIIKKINNLGLMTIFITDLISINARLIKSFQMIKNKKILVINKCDIIPNNLKLEHLEENIKNVYNLNNEVFFISAKDNLYLKRIMDVIAQYKEVIFAGETSSGKSTLINEITGYNLTTSKYSNTTLDFIKIKVSDYTIYDSPGFLFKEDKLPLKNIKLITKELKDDFVLTIDNVKLQGKSNLSCIINQDVTITSKKENINLNKEIKIDIPSDIILDNGFIFVKNKAIIYTNKDLEIRKSILKK